MYLNNRKDAKNCDELNSEKHTELLKTKYKCISEVLNEGGEMFSRKCEDFQYQVLIWNTLPEKSDTTRYKYLTMMMDL